MAAIIAVTRYAVAGACWAGLAPLTQRTPPSNTPTTLAPVGEFVRLGDRSHATAKGGRAHASGGLA